MKSWDEIEADFARANAVLDKMVASSRLQLFIASLSAFLLGLGAGLYLSEFCR